MMSSPDYSMQSRSHVQVNIYGTTVEALRGRGVDLERLLSSLGCRCIVMDVPELVGKVGEIVSGKNSSSTCSVSGNDVEKQNRKPEEQVEVQSSAPICELTPDSFVDPDLFLEVKGDPDAPSSSIALQPWSTEEGEIGQSHLEGETKPLKSEESKDNNAAPLLRGPRRRTPRLWYSPQDTPEAMKNKRIKLTRMKAKADREFQCRISGCGKILHFKQSCRRQGLDHVRSHFPRKTRRCKICDYAGNTNASVYNHHTSCHPNEFYPGPLATETKEDLEELQHLFHQAFPEIPGIETYMSMIS